MSASSVAEFSAGAIFGSALLTSGVYSPAVIVSQMHLHSTAMLTWTAFPRDAPKVTNFHMLKAFLGASACSAVIVDIANRSGHSPCRVRPPSSYGWFPYDANVIGGLLIGTGMTLTGACPGTVLTQIGAGVRSGMYVGFGALIGGVLYTQFSPYLRREPGPTKIDAEPKHTVQTKLNVSTSTVLVVYEALCLAMIVVTNTFAPQGRTSLSPILGGLVIGIAQAVTVLITRRTVGVSTAYQDLGRRLWRALGVDRFRDMKLVTPAVTFATGILAGSTLLAKSGYVEVPFETHQISNAAAVAGGAAMVFGAGLAGGCPSGHGISGMATFSLSSFISVAAMFGGGIGAALLLR